MAGVQIDYRVQGRRRDGPTSKAAYFPSWSFSCYDWGEGRGGELIEKAHKTLCLEQLCVEVAGTLMLVWLGEAHTGTKEAEVH